MPTIVIAATKQMSIRMKDIISELGYAKKLNLVIFTDRMLAYHYLKDNMNRISYFFIEVALLEDLETMAKLKKLKTNVKFLVIADSNQMQEKLLPYMLHLQNSFLTGITGKFLENSVTQIADCIVSKMQNQISISEETVGIDDILYFTSLSAKPNYIKVVGKSSTYILRGNLKQIETESRFLVRSDISYVVNIRNISAIDEKNKIIHFLPNEETAHLSRRNFKNFKSIME